MMRRVHGWIGLAAVALLALGTAGCPPKSNDQMANKSLWDRLGGAPAVTAVVDDFVGKAASDPKVNFTREGHPNHWNATPENVAKLKQHLVEFISSATGGPLQYHGKAMDQVHANMQISSEEFDAIAADLSAALDDKGVPEDLKNELLKVVGSTKDQIVGK